MLNLRGYLPRSHRLTLGCFQGTGGCRTGNGIGHGASRCLSEGNLRGMCRRVADWIHLGQTPDGGESDNQLSSWGGRLLGGERAIPTRVGYVRRAPPRHGFRDASPRLAQGEAGPRRQHAPCLPRPPAGIRRSGVVGHMISASGDQIVWAEESAKSSDCS